MTGQHRSPQSVAITAALALVMVAVLVIPQLTQGLLPAAQGSSAPLTFIAPPDFSLGNQRAWAVRCWNQLHPEHPVTYLELPAVADDQRAELMTKLQAGHNGYDVVGLDLIWTQEFAKGGLIRPLDEVAEKAEEVRSGLDRFFDPVRETVRYDDRDWGVPLHITVGLLYYDKQRHGRDEAPDTWENLEAALRSLELPEGVAGYLGQLWEYEGLTVNASEVIWGHGGAFINDRGEVTADRQDAVRGLEFLTRGLRDGWIGEDALDYSEQSSLNAFRNGEAVALRHWPYAYAQLNVRDSKVRGDNLGVAPLPGPNAFGGVNLTVSAFSQHPEAAYEFIEFITSNEVQWRMFQNGAYPPAIRSLYQGGAPNGQPMTKECEPNHDPETDLPLAPAQPLLTALKRAFASMRPRPPTPYYERITRLIQETVREVLASRNPGSAQERLEALADRLEAAQRGR